MRIVYLSPTGAVGGAERVLLDMLAVLRQQGAHDLHLVTLADGPLVPAASKLGIDTTVQAMHTALHSAGEGAFTRPDSLTAALQSAIVVARAGFAIGPFARRLGETVRRLTPDVVHSNGIKTHVLTHAAGVVNVPVIWHLHDFVGARRLTKIALRWASTSATSAIASSSAVARDIHTCLPSLAIRTMLNAIDTEHFAPASGIGQQLDQLAGMLPAQRGILRIGLVATYANWKGHEIFIRAAAKCVQKIGSPALRFYVIGGPIYHTLGSQRTRAELFGLANELGIIDHVGFIDFQSDIASIYRALDVIVHASTKPEPFGLTIVEAMASGRPVIVSGAGGAVELFMDGHDAVGFPPGDVIALAQTITRLAQDEDLRHRIASNARATALKKFSRARLGDELPAIYAEAVELFHKRK